VLVDAFLVRMMLVPAVLALLDRRAWWLPGWLDRRMPYLDIEGEKILHELEPAPPAEGKPATEPTSAPR
jgi:putative drug exporter of the RND superfamily